MNRDQKLAVRVSAAAVTVAVFAVTWAAVRPSGGQAETATAGGVITQPDVPAAYQNLAPRVIVHTRTRAS